ncbi:hypothetical protein K0U07_01700 [bacterium]|nr:hypothetical protein [bacterium]
MLVEKIIFILLLIDAIGCNLIVWFGDNWYHKHLRWFSRFFPPAKGWSVYYLILVLWAGTLIFRIY